MPWSAATELWRRRQLLRRLVVNEALGKYRGSVLGMAWSFLNPLLMLAVFTIAFGSVFKGAAFQNGLPARPAVLPIFCGMVVFGIFGEALGRAPTAVLSQPNYVKKIVFPLELLPAAITGSALLHAGIGLCILVVGMLALGVVPGAAALLLPIVIVPIGATEQHGPHLPVQTDACLVTEVARRAAADPHEIPQTASVIVLERQAR